MIRIRRGNERGRSDFGWLDSRHTFSFGAYRDPDHMGFRTLRVINDDRVAPGAGFGTHPHRDMEILSYVLEGAMEHRDSMGNGSVIREGELQRMTAGTGVTHSEHNASKTAPLHFLQIWILPEARGLAPGYEQKSFPLAERRGRLALLASRDGRNGSLTIHQDAALLGASLRAGERAVHELAPGRHAWVHVVRGHARLGEVALAEGDGAAVSDEQRIELAGEGDRDAEVLVFDLG